MGKKINKEIRGWSVEELHSRLLESRKEYLKLNVQASTGRSNNPGKLKQVRKNIARILTVLTQKEVTKTQ